MSETTLYGTIQSVDTTPLGSGLTAAAAVGATVLSVADVADFYESGGFLTLNGAQYAFTINEGTDTLTVTPPLTVAGSVDDFVSVWDNSAGATAVAVTAAILPQAADDFSEPVIAFVEAGLIQYLPIGARNVFNGEMETCTAEERHGLWYVTSIQGRAMTTKGRQTSPTVTVTSVAAGAQASSTVALAQMFALLSLTVDQQCRVRLYARSADMTTDASRPIGTDPTYGLGVTLDYAAPAAGTYVLSPMVVGASMETTPSAVLSVMIDNTGTSTATINASFTYLVMG